MGLEPGTSLSLLRWNPDTRPAWKDNSAIVEKDRKALKSFFDLLTLLDTVEDKAYDTILATRQKNNPEKWTDGIRRKHQNELIGQIYPDSMLKALEVLYPGTALSSTRGRFGAKVDLGKARLGEVSCCAARSVARPHEYELILRNCNLKSLLLPSMFWRR
jgi:hypothetical protein